MTPLYVGDVTVLEVTVRDAATGQTLDPTNLECVVTTPAGVSSTKTPTRLGAGSYQLFVDCTEAGRWKYLWRSPGPIGKGVSPGTFDVRNP